MTVTGAHYMIGRDEERMISGGNMTSDQGMMSTRGRMPKVLTIEGTMAKGGNMTINEGPMIKGRRMTVDGGRIMIVDQGMMITGGNMIEEEMIILEQETVVVSMMMIDRGGRRRHHPSILSLVPILIVIVVIMIETETEGELTSATNSKRTIVAIITVLPPPLPSLTMMMARTLSLWSSGNDPCRTGTWLRRALSASGRTWQSPRGSFPRPATSPRWPTMCRPR
jgi:hypothetical protein